MKIATSRVHFIGIGGIGMSGIAELLYNMGATVSGSDIGENTQTQRLKHMGVTVFKGHSAENLQQSDVVVYSSAVKPNNIEYVEALIRKIPLIPRAEALAEVMRLKRGVAVGGTHGKTTTTSLLASVFVAGGLDPTIVVGGRLESIKSTSKLGRGKWILAEADESDGNFLKLSPEVSIITNIDKDHLDHYGNLTAIKKSFYEFACRIPFYGSLVACGDDQNVRETFSVFSKKCVFYGFDFSNEYVLNGENGNYKIFHHDKMLGEIEMPMPGKHNALNALASIIVGIQAGISFQDCKKGIEQFKGVDRRFQFKGNINGVDYYDDYGHHPTEVKAVLSAFKEKYPARKLKVLFQPHRYSRTQECWTDFTQSFHGVDELYLLDIYPAGEEAIAGVTSEELGLQIEGANVLHISGLKDEEVISKIKSLQSHLKQGDIFLSLGAGSVSRLAEVLVSKEH